MRQFHPAIFCLIIAIMGFVLSGCSTDTLHESVNLETITILEMITGITMEDVIELEGAPEKRTPDRLVYKYFTSEKVTPVWAYILLVGVAGGGGGTTMPDLDYVNHDFYCLTLKFENNILVSHSTTDREEDESC